ncbi:MAG: putative FAD-linked oxidoreductase [Candidatus Thorarchaeota archaeon AB_25]|nr:MAG: putative FAD-linked oxidoreductase [Candidatus Thorarchaeota archaeon AB_25]
MKKIADLLKKVVGENNVVTAKVDRVAYARDLTPYYSPPDLIVFPESRDHVIEILKLASKERIPITPRGGGASFQGSSLPVRGGIILDLSRMNKILEISKEDMIAIVQPGVRYETFEHELNKHGLTFPHDVGSHDAATIGGILASDSNGHHAYKHGRVSPWVQGMEVVLVDGSTLKLGSRAPRYNIGYNLSALISGSIGTLGVITEAILRLIPKMDYDATIGAFFQNLDDLMKASHAITMSGVDCGTLEATDGYTVNTISDVMNLGFPRCEGNFVGDVQAFSEEELQLKLAVIKKILEEHNGENVIIARDDETTKILWAPRMEIDIAIMKVHPGYREIGFAAADPCVPLSKMADAMREIGRIIRSNGILAAVFCHTGIGIIHPAVLFNPTNREHWIGVKKAEKEILEYVESIGGVITAEHGLGYVKNIYVEHAVGQLKLKLDREIKRVFDPDNILNPGKMGLDTTERDTDVQFMYDEYVTDSELWGVEK